MKKNMLRLLLDNCDKEMLLEAIYASLSNEAILRIMERATGDREMYEDSSEAL